MKIVKGAVLAVGFTAAVSVAAPGFAGGNKYEASTVDQVCEDADGNEDHVTFNGPLKLWPPNHKFVNESITATSSDSTEQVSLTEAIKATDAVGGDGGPKHDPDWTPANGAPATTGTGAATVSFQLRSERSGKGDGRTYTIDWTATFGSRNSCSSTDGEHVPFVVTVPHDMRPSNR